jgi:hypothetical protein
MPHRKLARPVVIYQYIYFVDSKFVQTEQPYGKCSCSEEPNYQSVEREVFVTYQVYHPQTAKGVRILRCDANLRISRFQMTVTIGKQNPYRVALLVVYNIRCIINFNNRVVCAIDICQALVCRIDLVKPPYISCRSTTSSISTVT